MKNEQMFIYITSYIDTPTSYVKSNKKKEYLNTDVIVPL